MIKKIMIFIFSLLVFFNIGFSEDFNPIPNEDSSSFIMQKDPVTEKCVAAFHRKEGKIIERCFYEYDSKGHVVKTVFDNGVQEDPESFEQVTYRQIVEIHRNELDSNEVMNRAETTLVFDADQNVVCRKEMICDLKNNRESESYDIQVENEEWKHIYFQRNFNEFGQLTTFFKQQDDEKYQTNYEYDRDGRLVAIIKPNGIGIHYNYNINGLIDRLVSTDGSIHYRFSYDSEKRLIEVNDLISHTIQTRVYDLNHDLIEESWGLNQYIRYDFKDDQTGSLSIELSDGSKIDFEYESDKIKTLKRSDSEEKLSYEQRFIYDSESNLHSREWVDETEFIFSIEERLRSLGSAGETFVSNSTDTNEIENHSFFDPKEKKLFSEYQCGSPEFMNEIKSHFFSREKVESSHAGDLSVLILKQSSSEGDVLYTYDALDRLTRVEFFEKKAFTYLYDAFHRRIKKQVWNWDREKQGWDLVSEDRSIYQNNHEIAKINECGGITMLHLIGSFQRNVQSTLVYEVNQKALVPCYDTFGGVRNYIHPARKEKIERNSPSPILSNSIIRDVPRGYVLFKMIDYPIDEETGWIFTSQCYYDPAECLWVTPNPHFYLNESFFNFFDKNQKTFFSSLCDALSVDRLSAKIKEAFESCLSYLKYCVEHVQEEMNVEPDLSDSIHEVADQITQFIFGNYYIFLGKNIDPNEIGVFGEKELNPKIRITFINGMLTKKLMMMENLKLISDTHGKTKVHYIYRNTEGWVWDSANALMIKVGYLFGYRSHYAHLLAEVWKSLIAEMGGVEGGGIILHYAHSLGGTDTDRARTLLTPEEQKMVRVVTIGSPTFIRNKGFESVWNHTSVNDGVRLFAPLGHYRHYFSEDSNVRFHGLFKLWPLPLFDHMIDCETYRNLLAQLGEEFLQEFNLN